MCLQTSRWQWGEIRQCGLITLFHFHCNVWVLSNRTVAGLSVYGRNCRGMRRAVQCEGREVGMHKDFSRDARKGKGVDYLGFFIVLVGGRLRGDT